MVQIIKATYDDLEEILALQYLAYRSEAELIGDYTIPPLLQKLPQLVKEYEKGVILKAVEHGGIIGSVRGVKKGDTLLIDKLMVNPNRQREGIGTRLLREIERVYPQQRYELFISTKDENNLRFYRREGYHPFREERLESGIKLIYLEKQNGQKIS